MPQAATASDIAARIRQRAKELGRPLAQVLRGAGLGPSFIKDLDQNPRASPRILSIAKLAEELDVPTEWLLEGRGRRGARSDSAQSQREMSLDERGEDISDYALVPEYDVQLSAGAGAMIDAESVRRLWGLPRTFLGALGLAEGHAAAVQIVGDSMAPLLHPGDLVLLDLRSKNPALPAIYAIWDGDATVCKRVEKIHGSDPPRLRIISENTAYTPYEVLAEQVKIIGRVAWYGRQI